MKVRMTAFAVCVLILCASAVFAQGTIDAVLNWGNGKAFFFKGDEYIRYDITTHKVDPGYPKKIGNAFPGMTFTSGVDAAINWGKVDGHDTAFFFKGDEYIRYDIEQHRVDAGYPKKIGNAFPGMTFQKVDAVINWLNGKAYFFSGDEFIRYDITTNKVDPGYPKKIGNAFPGMTFSSGVDACVEWGKIEEHNTAFFFKGDEYIRYDMEQHRVDAGYPRKIGNAFPGLMFSAPGSEAAPAPASSEGP